MYIRSVHIHNIKSIERFDMPFEEGQEAGWHVLIGDNSSGKTTVARAISISLVGFYGLYVLRQEPKKWIGTKGKRGEISVDIAIEPSLDSLITKDTISYKSFLKKELILSTVVVVGNLFGTQSVEDDDNDFPDVTWASILDNSLKGWFSAGYGPFRRFSGGDSEVSKTFSANPRAGAHLSMFGEDIALTEVIPWLKDLRFQELDEKKDSFVLKSLKTFINEAKLLPSNGILSKINNEGVFFIDGNGIENNLLDLSDGYRAILSLTLELIRQLIVFYGEEKVFENIQKGKMNIPLPGVVIIDEIDAHLHPTWQTKIGQWFTKYFPKLQFIVTTHSPLICRACGETGKIFKLSAPGSENESAEITGIDRDRLVFGDILEAYETDAFGDGVEWSEEGRNLQKEYRDLVYKKRYGVEMTEPETKRFNHLKQIFKSNVEAS